MHPRNTLSHLERADELLDAWESLQSAIMSVGGARISRQQFKTMTLEEFFLNYAVTNGVRFTFKPRQRHD